MATLFLLLVLAIGLLAPMATNFRITFALASALADAVDDAANAGTAAVINIYSGTVPTEAIERVVRYARSKGAARFGGLVPTNLYGQRVSLGLLESIARARGCMVAQVALTTMVTMGNQASGETGLKS